jgi:hypothetical protein
MVLARGSRFSSLERRSRRPQIGVIRCKRHPDQSDASGNGRQLGSGKPQCFDLVDYLGSPLNLLLGASVHHSVDEIFHDRWDQRVDSASRRGAASLRKFRDWGIASKASWGYDAGTMRISPKKRETAETAASLIVFYTAINDGSTIYSTLVTPGVGML